MRTKIVIYVHFAADTVISPLLTLPFTYNYIIIISPKYIAPLFLFLALGLFWEGWSYNSGKVDYGRLWLALHMWPTQKGTGGGGLQCVICIVGPQCRCPFLTLF